MAIETTSDLSLVGTSQIVDGSVTSAKIGAGAVGSAAISAGSINSTHIGANAVVSGDIAAGAVGSAALAAGAVVAAAIAAGAVGTAAISSGAATSGQILQANGSGAVTFATPAAGGGITLLGTITASSATAVSFTSIPTTYKNLRVRWQQVYTSVSNSYLGVRFNSDTSSAYSMSGFRFGPSGFAAYQVNSQSTAWFDAATNAAVGYATNSAERERAKGEFVIYDYANTSDKRLAYCNSTFTDATADAVGILQWCVYTPTGTAITSIEFVRNSTQTINGKFLLYGES